MADEIERVSDDEIDAEDVTSLPNKEVMSLLDVNANVDLGLNLAAPVDLAVAANLNVAAPIEAAAAANLLSPDAQAIGIAQQHGTIDQGISGEANATAPQHAEVTQDANADDGAVAPLAQGAGGVLEGATGAVDGAGVAPAGDVGGAAGGVTSGVGNLLSGGSLLDANIDIHANANVAAPINGAVAANANVAAPIDAAVAANVGSDHAVAQALAAQDVNIQQHLDDVEANATAQQDATVDQQ